MLNRIRKILKSGDAAFITSEWNRKYLSGFSASDGFIVITERDAVFFADGRYIEAAQKQIKNMQVRLFSGFSDIKDYLIGQKIERVIIEADEITVASLKNYRKVLGIRISNSNILSDTLAKLRMIKSQDEIENIKAAQRITDATFSHILNFIKVGVTEKDIALELEFFMRKMGSEGVAFDTIVVSGKNSSLPHGVPSQKKIQNGDFITMDFGAVVNGYRSDMTRTVAVRNVSEEQKAVYEKVLTAQKAALKKIKAGKICSEIDKIARDIIDSSEYKGAFNHSLGHSVGIDIHEKPNFSPKCNVRLEKNMVLTVEPGIYLPDKFGVRIEDMVLVTDNGVVNLTNSAKELIII